MEYKVDKMDNFRMGKMIFFIIYIQKIFLGSIIKYEIFLIIYYF